MNRPPIVDKQKEGYASQTVMNERKGFTEEMLFCNGTEMIRDKLPC